MDLDKAAASDFGVVYLGFMKAIGLFNALKEELLNRKCEDLFNVYLDPDQIHKLGFSRDAQR